MDYFERNVTLIVNDYINHYLSEYSKNPSVNWRAKDTALFLFSAIAIKSSTAKGGVTSTNLLIDVVQFWAGNVQGEFSKRAAHPVLQADYIRYIYMFRNQVCPCCGRRQTYKKLTSEQLRTIMPFLVAYLSTEDYVVYTYAAVTLDRLLLLKRDGVPIFTKTDLAPLLRDILASTLQKIEVDPRPEKLAENDFLMKCNLSLGCGG
jgi:exportin-2 (importin alpha re-exporter)